MANITIYSGTSTWATGKTAFAFYDEDLDFQNDAPLVANWCAKRLGYPLVDIELQDQNFFTAFEEAISEYGAQVYQFQIINNLGRIKGTSTGSALNQVLISADYGNNTGNISQGSGLSYNLTDQRLFTASLDVRRGKQHYNLLSSDAGIATATITFSGQPASGSTIDITTAYGDTITITSTLSSSISQSIDSEGATVDNIVTASAYLNQMVTGSSISSSAHSLFHAIESGSLSGAVNVNISGSETGNVVLTLSQTVEGLQGNQEITSNLANVSTTNFSGGQSGLNFEQSGSHVQSGRKQIVIKKIYHYAPAAINRYFDPYAGTGTGIQSLMQAFGMGNYSPGVNFMLMPMYFDVLKLQPIELNDSIRKSAYHFELNSGKFLKLFPIPTNDYKLWFEYTMADSSVSAAQEETDPDEDKPTNIVTDISNAPYEKPTYAFINEPGRQWIRKYTLALSKEMLGVVRGKYQALPIPGSETTLDYSRLLDEARAEKETLIAELREDLDATTTLAQAERSTAESEQTQLQYSVDNPYQIYIH